MNRSPLDKFQPALIYLGKVSLTAFLFYFSSGITSKFLIFFGIFNHEDYAVFWPPSGIALGLMMIWGRSIWPGVILGSVIFTLGTNWFQNSNPGIVNSIIIISIFAVGRIAEPIAGHYLLMKTGVLAPPFKKVRSIFYFIIIALTVAVLSSAAGGLSTHLIRNDSLGVFLNRSFGWYVGNVLGILIFAPFTYAFYYHSRLTLRSQFISIITITGISCMTFLTIYLIGISLRDLHLVLENSLPFLIIPFLILIAFRFNLLVATYTILIISFITIYFTALKHGPFVSNNNDLHYTVWLLQSFLLVIAIATLVFHAAANERKENRIKLEEAKAKAEDSDRLKSSFLANMSHEIRTPMNAIMGFSELLSRPNLSMEKREEFTHLIHQRSKDLLAVVNDILDISKIESGQMTYSPSVGNIQELTDQLFKSLVAEVSHLNNKSIEIKVNNELKGNENIVLADFPKLHQVLINLLSNALKFTESGVIEFGYKRQDKDTLLFYVQDTGIGIAHSKHELIFKPFQQASVNTHQQYGGTGLGLAIIKGLIKLWQGEIWLESEPGIGSTFYFTMPYLPQQKSTMIQPSVSEKLNWENLSIVLVEDDLASANYIKEILTEMNCHITHVSSGIKAIEAIHQDAPSLVLLDLGLPDIPGLKVVEYIKKTHPELIIVAVTAFATAEHKTQAMEAGCLAFLTKPLSSQTLLQTLTSLIENKKV